MQEMKRRIYETFGRGAMQNKNKSTNDQTTGFGRKKAGGKAAQDYHLVKKPPLTDLDLRNIVAAMLLYPQLISKYEERLTAFEINRSPMARVLNDIIEINQSDEPLDSEILLEKVRLNFADAVGDLWELNMYRQQKTSMLDLKQQIDSSLQNIQLKQIDIDIKECVKQMESQPDNLEELSERYARLIKERNTLLAED